MDKLFHIVTDKVVMTWSKGRGKDRPVLPGIHPPPGCLIITGRRLRVIFSDETWRADVPEAIASDHIQTVGPRLFEETDYSIFLQSRDGQSVRIWHRDPLIIQHLHDERQGSLLHGLINFRSQVGRSLFTVMVGDEPEFDFEVEVFPTKLDYQSDYQQILAEVQEVMTGLALEYLRSTYRLGAISPVPNPSQLEWLTLLRQMADQLERALYHVAEHPIRGLTREPVSIRADQVKHVDSSLRAAIRKGAGRGGWLSQAQGVAIRQHLDERRPRPTLDTPEHRWLAGQLDRIRRRLGELLQHEAAQRQERRHRAPSDGQGNERQRKTREEIVVLESRMARLCRLEPLASAEGQPPPGFASLQLIGAPGYREAYQACLVLSLGLRVMDGPLQLSIKDLGLLYEYWCFLALLRLVAEETGQAIAPETLFAITQQGVQVLLKKGQRTSIPFDAQGGRLVTVTYNPRFANEPILIPQQPDMLVTIEDQDWPKLHLLLDAKYRVEAADEYQARYGSPGPPEDALNVLHRYRDAILERTGCECDDHPKRTVVQAAAVFPFTTTLLGEFKDGRLWQSLNRIGIGAIPLLPGTTEYLQCWLRAALREGGWDLADRVIDHRSHERALEWRQAAVDPVLIGTLNGRHPAEHLQWIIDERRYYMPVIATQRRQYATRIIAFYSSLTLRTPGAITHMAQVERVEVVTRGQIQTPWPGHMAPADNCVLFHLSEIIPLSPPIDDRGSKAQTQGIRDHRWTSRLGFERARSFKELLLETEPEWRLYERLKAADIPFTLEDPQPPRLHKVSDPVGRVWFVLTEMGVRIRYAGDAGFVMRSADGTEQYVARVDEVVGLLGHAAGELGAHE
jgi:hypothetical protein